MLHVLIFIKNIKIKFLIIATHRESLLKAIYWGETNQSILYTYI